MGTGRYAADRRILVLWLLLAAAGCNYMKTPFALKQLNGSVSAADIAPRPSDADRVAEVIRSQLVDSYFNPHEVGSWLDKLGEDPTPLRELIGCLAGTQSSGQTAARFRDPDDCRKEFSGAVGRGQSKSRWGLPTDRPENLADSSLPLQREVDAERFMANVYIAGATLAEIERGCGRDDFQEGDGFRTGAAAAKDYIHQRSWHRNAGQHNTAVVLSGGSANGAFTAGAVWRLLSIIAGCRAHNQCARANIDLVVGTSTGALIGVVIDLFFTPSFEQRALDLLVHSYTCSTASDLYCAVNKYDWKLVDDLKGLVRFDGVERLLETHMVDESLTNRTELVTVSVRLEDGHVYAQSDQDPADRGTRADRIHAVLASIVQPVLAEPVTSIVHEGVVLGGTFVDGGLRSILPVLAAVNRGADRVLVMTSSTMEPPSTASPKHAVGILMNVLDVLLSSVITEPQLAASRALTRRMLEYRVCCDRFTVWGNSTEVEGKPRMSACTLDADVERLCNREALDAATARKIEPNWWVPPMFPEVAASYRSSWLFRPEQTQTVLTGYRFDPKVMRELFLLGATSFQRRCHELTQLLDLTDPVVGDLCEQTPETIAELARDQFGPEEDCLKDVDELRLCDD